MVVLYAIHFFIIYLFFLACSSVCHCSCENNRKYCIGDLSATVYVCCYRSTVIQGRTATGSFFPFTLLYKLIAVVTKYLVRLKTMIQ